MNLPEELRKLKRSLERQLADNGSDIDRLDQRRSELVEERRRLIRGIEGIRREISKLEGDVN